VYLPWTHAPVHYSPYHHQYQSQHRPSVHIPAGVAHSDFHASGAWTAAHWPQRYPAGWA
jgi:hypothetical protein